MLLDLWRAAGRHTDLTESLPRLAAVLSRRLPADCVVVRLVDGDAVETVAAASSGGRPVPRLARTPLSAGRRAIEGWLDAGAATRLRDAPALRPLLPERERGSILAGPLATPAGERGVLLLVRDAPFSQADREALGDALEPFAVALGVHRQLHELLRLREAAEADRRALLRRLGRRQIVDEVVGADGSLLEVMAQVDRVAPTDVPVLLLGETGTGKEVLARAIHTRSRRADGPVVRINCGAIPPDLVDSELFGHEKGAFTGASASRPGWFERADGGTLFLDEIGELPLAAQVRLLRVLQDGTFERVGGHRPYMADVRVVAATHRDLEAMTHAGAFREDLWYRLTTFPIYIPPLRARLADLPALARHFAHNAGLRFGDAPLAVSEADLDRLAAYPWPGNVRELGSTIERAAILGGGHRLDVAGAMGSRLAPPPPLHSAPGGLMSLDDAQADHIARALRQSDGCVEGPDGAAALLGLNPATLRGRMRRLGIDWAGFRARRGGDAA